MAKVNGTDVGVYIDDTLITAAQSAEIAFSVNMIETTSKDSGGDSEFIPGLRSGTVSVEALYTDASGDQNQTDLFTLLKNRTSVTIKWGVNSTGKNIYSGSAYISSLSPSAPMEDVVTYSAEFQLTGAITETTVA